eukprot:superscaffoldBa00006147_g21196
MAAAASSPSFVEILKGERRSSRFMEDDLQRNLITFLNCRGATRRVRPNRLTPPHKGDVNALINSWLQTRARGTL